MPGFLWCPGVLDLMPTTCLTLLQSLMGEMGTQEDILDNHMCLYTGKQGDQFLSWTTSGTDGGHDIYGFVWRTDSGLHQYLSACGPLSSGPCTLRARRGLQPI